MILYQLISWALPLIIMSALPVLRESYKTVAVPSVFRLEERSGREGERALLAKERLNSGYNTLVT